MKEINYMTGKPKRHCVIATGQTSCWDESGKIVDCAGTGQDGEIRPGIPWPIPRFSIVDGGARDRLTGLTWPTDANHLGWPLTWYEAREAAAELRRRGHLGHDDWRLPNRRELWSLISYADRNPALPSGHPFRNIFLGWYWTSTTAARNRDYAWAVQMNGGRVFFEAKERDAFVWPCRGASQILASTCDRPTANDGVEETGVIWPKPRFEIIEERIEDRLTGLIWLRDADFCRRSVTWSDALAAVDRLNANRLGPRIWHLPTITELESLLDSERSDPSLPDGHPFGRVGSGYWSSTTSSFEPDWAMVLHLGRGAVGVGVKEEPRFLAWPVLGPSGD
jgi:hypothetical protein